MPMNYELLEQDEMMYLDGGLYISNNSLKGLVMSFCSNPYNISTLSAAVKYGTAVIGAKLSTILGPVGWAITGAVGSWIIANAYKFAERTVTALSRNKGVDFFIGWEWAVIPVLDGNIR